MYNNIIIHARIAHRLESVEEFIDLIHIKCRFKKRF